MDKLDIEDLIKKNYKNLSRGLMQKSYPLVFEAHKNLYDIGKPVIPFIKNKILEIEWSNSKYVELSAYISGIYSLLHDLDENEANLVYKDIISNGCPEHIKAILESVNLFSIQNYKHYNIKGIDIFEYKFIKAKCDIKPYLEKWLNNVPKNDLDKISRLYVITREKINASGTYTPVINSVALLWDNKYRERSFLFKIFSLFTEKVLYHEIGHHKHRHTFGTDPDQEKQADRYAGKLIGKSHPILFIILKMLSKIGVKSHRNYYRWGL